MWDRGRRGKGKEQEEKGVPPRPPPARKACGEFLPAGLMRGYYPRDELMREARGLFVRFRVLGAPVADSLELRAVAISTHSWVNSRSGFAVHNPIERSGRWLPTLAKWSEIPRLSGFYFPKPCFPLP